MIPATQPRKPRNSSKVNLIISLVFHGLIVAALVFFAAREGLLGKKIQTLSVNMVKKEKPPEKPKEPDKPKEEPPKVVEPKLTATPKIAPPTQVAPPPTTAVAPPPTVDMSSFFTGKEVKTGDAIDLYKGQVESVLLGRWNRPTDLDDAKYVAEVDLTVGPDGQLGNPVWKKGSGDKRWDDSVRQALAATKYMNTKPPTNFPSHFTVVFDVDSSRTESIMP